ncbi:MAG: DUF932 domain-containing protein [Dermatophilaceae bacterium]
MNLERAQTRVDRDGSLALTARNADLAELATILKDQHARKVDVVASATAIRSRGGLLNVTGAEPVIDADGVTSADGIYRPMNVATDGIADKLSVPRAYLRRLRDDRPDLFDANVNGLLHGRSKRHADGTIETLADPDSRSFLVRAFRGDDDRPGVARAFLSDRYRIVDNLDVLTAALDGVRATGMEVEIEACDLTDRRMMVRIASPEIHELAPDILDGYRSPFTGETGADNPIISAGFVISNSETGGGAFTIVPRLRVEVCRNGMTIAKDALRAVHLGGKLDDGVIRWSDYTQQKNLDLVASQARDAVSTFLDVDYVRAKIAEIRTAAGIEISKPAEAVQHVAKTLRFGQDAADSILDHFIRGGQTNAIGVMQAVTSYAQTIDDADTAAEIEASALDVLVALR